MSYDPDDPLEGATRCPHCDGLALTTRHDEYGHVCNICGAPRVVAEGVELSGKEKEPLERARTAKRDRLLWRIGAVVGGASSGFILVVGLILALIFSFGWLLGGFAFALPWILLAVAGAAKARSSSHELHRALGEAWRSAARDLAAKSEGGVSAEQIAEKMQMNEEAAEHLVAELSVESEMDSRMTDDGRIVLEEIGGARIDPEASVGDPLEEQFAALEQAEAEASEAEALEKERSR